MSSKVGIYLRSLDSRRCLVMKLVETLRIVSAKVSSILNLKLSVSMLFSALGYGSFQAFHCLLGPFSSLE
jgi:hypothetical protein